MKNITRHFYSFVLAILFMVIAAGSAKVNKIHCGAFSKTSTGEETGNQNYVVLNDGTKVTGDKISWKAGMLVKDQIKVDDQKFHLKETVGYFRNGIYYARVGNDYAQRIVHGALNLYYTEETVTSTTTEQSTPGRTIRRTSTRQVCTHYVQIGEDGPLEIIANQKDILKYVKDCPDAVEMIDKKDKAIRRAIRKDRFYLNQVFVTYNNGCKSGNEFNF
jgi:hypothetical protein